MSWIDRLTAKAAIAKRLVCGQLRWEGAAPLKIRGALAKPGEVLFPNQDGTFGVDDLRGIRADRRTIPDDDALRCLRVMGTGIGKRLGTPYLEWLDESPLMPLVDDTLDETELEQVAKSELGRLEAVCRRPRTHLKYEEERQLVARCKRPAARAPMTLASHSEDWERKTLWGVRPRRILGMIREDLYDLYENRLTVALIDHVDVALIQRIRDVRRIFEQARSVARWQLIVESGKNFRRASRICKLWGELWSDEGLLTRAKQALTRLRHLRRRILALKDSALYRRIGGRNRTIELRMTNVLTHDDRYRGVGALWEAWQRHVLLGQMTPQDLWDREQSAFEGMQLFGVLLLVRALDSLGFIPEEALLEQPLGPGSKLSLQGPLGGLDMEWSEQGAVTLRRGESEPLQVVMLPAMLASTRTTIDWITDLQPSRSIILFLESDPTTLPRELRLRLCGPGPREQLPLFVPVAPWQLESVERLARALRWELWSDAMKQYPKKVPYPHPNWKPPGTLPAFVEVGNGGIHIVKPPTSRGWSQLEKRIHDHESEKNRIRSQLQALNPKRRRDKTHLKKELADVESTLANDQTLHNQVIANGEALKELLTCPTCHKASAPMCFEHTTDQYRISCHTCQSSWGLRACNACREQIAFINCPENIPGADSLKIDAAYGCDVIAFPLENDAYLCPACGQPSG